MAKKKHIDSSNYQNKYYRNRDEWNRINNTEIGSIIHETRNRVPLHENRIWQKWSFN